VSGTRLADPRIDVVVNRGRRLAGAINTGMQVATSPFVALLLGDDMWTRQAAGVLATHVDANPAVDFFHSSRMIIDEQDRPITPVLESRASFVDADFRWGSPVKHLLCWRRKFGLAVGGVDESIQAIGADDYDFPWTMAQAGARFKAIPDCLYLYRNHSAGHRLTTDTPLSVNIRDVNAILRKHGVAWATRALIIGSRWRHGSLGDQSKYRTRVTKGLAEWLERSSRKG
jgi:hypothetical protein